MKKIAIFLILTVYLIASTTSVWANADSEKVHISFKVGDDILKINNEDIKVEKPFVVNGTTLVPLRVITESFGSEVQWNGEERSITLTDSDVVIKLKVDSKEAIVNGVKINMLQAPKIVNSVTMVPLRFITENFGAEVKYNSETREIEVTKELAVNSDGIQDFAEILKKTSDEKVGDSYYKWSMELPENVKLYYRSFSGTYNSFEEYDETYYIYVRVRDEEESDSIDSLFAEKLQYVNRYTLVSQEKLADDKQEYIKVVYKDSEGIYEDRIYINDGKIFDIGIEVYDEEKYKNSDELRTLLDSFKTEFRDGENIKDLSNVTEDGYRKYENEKQKWSVNVLADWREIKSSNKVNKVDFAEVYDRNDIEVSRLAVKMTSKQDGLTLDKWVRNEQKLVEENYNPKLVKIIKTEEVKIDGKRSKKVYSSIQMKDAVIYECTTYLVGDNYKYQLVYSMTSDNYKDSKKKARMEKMIHSFVFTEPNVEEVGQLIDADEITINEGVKEIRNKDLKWSFEVPYDWTSNYTSNDKDKVIYGLEKFNVGMSLIVYENISDKQYEKFMDQAEEELESSIGIEELKQSTISSKGTRVERFTYETVMGDLNSNVTQYVINKNEKIYLVTFVIADLTSSEKNKKTIEDIWKSFEFDK
ncbi:stalk domain-containing protein [Wukongibacter baidiensis]|uniref:stalk domain-containing protein n=1 Tax=Wukongibacter baidiensis TaxID=1723361 RepID=UPI003D7F876E